MSFYIFNEQIASESQLRKLLAETQERALAEQTFEQDELLGLADVEFI